MTTTQTKIALLTGDTFQVRAALQGVGWKWDADRKAYTMEVNGDCDADDVVRMVRATGGIRNRPKKLVVTFS